MTESRSPQKCPELQQPGNRYGENGTSRSVRRSQNRNKCRDAGQDRELTEGFLDHRVGMTGQLQGRNNRRWKFCVWDNGLLQLRPQMVQSGSVWWSACRHFCIMATDPVLQGVQKCTANSEELVPPWQMVLFICLSWLLSEGNQSVGMWFLLLSHA